jgi:hypothetical protein
MNAVWSAYKNSNSAKIEFTEAEIATLIASIKLWKKNYKDHKTILYCDDAHYTHFAHLRIIRFWDEVRVVNLDKRGIDTNVFWAATKILVLKQVEAPVVHVDNDWFGWQNLGSFFDSDVSGAYKENTEGFYLPIEQERKYCNLTKLSGGAVNTSILYFKDEKQKQSYCNLVIKYMKKRSLDYDESVFNKDKSLYMIFAEQQLLYEFCNNKRLNLKMLIKDIYNPTQGFTQEIYPNGIFTSTVIEKFCGHLGHMKTVFRNNPSAGNIFANNMYKRLAFEAY